jgi:hypothetical protein
MLDGLQICQLQLTKSDGKVRSAHHLPQTLLQIHRILQVAVVAAGKDSSRRPIHSYTISRALELRWRKHRRDGGGPGEQNAPARSPPPRRPSPCTQISPAKTNQREDVATSSPAPPQKDSPGWESSSSTQTSTRRRLHHHHGATRKPSPTPIYKPKENRGSPPLPPPERQEGRKRSRGLLGCWWGKVGRLPFALLREEGEGSEEWQR